jgi:hypothetical protein
MASKTKAQLLQQLSPVEQGGVEQRSSLPQQVFPGARWGIWLKTVEAESTFST